MHTLCKIRFFATLCALALLAGVQTAGADSYFSSIGLGLPRYFVSQKAVAMGGAGIGVAESMTLNAMNPASNDIRSATCLAVQFEYEFVRNHSQIGQVNTANGNAAGLQFMFPVKKNLTFISMLQPLTLSRYLLKAEQQADTLNFARTVKGKGGLSAGSLGLQYGYKNKVSVAGMINFNFGSMNEEWGLQFEPSDYVDTEDTYNSHLSGVSYTIGLLAKPATAWSVGLIYQTGSDLTHKTDISSSSGYSESQPSGKIAYPAAYGLGLSWTIAKTQWALDYYVQDWSRYRVDGKERDDFRAYRRIGGGLEWLRSNRSTDSYGRRVAWRFGLYYAQLPFANTAGEAVSEKFITTGMSLPFQMNNGRIDMALEIGRRGDQSLFPFQENIYRFSVSVVGGERWFMRR
jgi:hypothetical protein